MCLYEEEAATWWRSALLWQTFFSTAVVVVVLRGFIEYCNSGQCGLFGRGSLILFDVNDVKVSYHVNDLLLVALINNIEFHCDAINGEASAESQHLALHLHLPLRPVVLGVVHWISVDSAEVVCPTPEGSDNFKQFNCPSGHYNDLASLLYATNDDAVRNIFSSSTPSEFHLLSLLIFFPLYCVLGLVTFGIAVPFGLFLPIILMGSAYGRLLALALQSYIHSGHDLYAVLGAAALMSSSMRMTVSLCVIFPELTNNLLLLPQRRPRR
ncbi:chloride channel protein CLC-a-like [Zingiber officinale]|uniref:chloride channel protein CLC-a-like n=1 Tax=Zingiber officinale TaxID=94328 RepID=UPI001C4B075D|nr:chloride channel protein CLC-a-like [Zingiber officinale]